MPTRGADRPARALAGDDPLRVAFEAAGFGIWEADLATAELQISSRLAAWLGLPPDVATRHRDHWRERVHPEDRERVEAAFQEAVEGRGEYDVEYRILSNDGDIRWLASRAVILCDPADRPLRAVGFAMDITSRKRSEEADAYLAAIIEGSDDAIVGNTLDAIVTSWNKSAERVFGYTAEEMVGTSIMRIVPPECPDDVSRILATIRRGGRVDHCQTERIRKDGRRIRVSLTVSPIKDAAGRIIGASKIARDVTGQRQSEDVIRHAQERLRAVIDSATDAIVTLDGDHRIMIFNAAAERMFRCPAREALGHRLDRFIPPASRERYGEYIRASGNSDTSARAMGGERLLSALRAGGEEFPVEAQISQATVGGQKLFTVILRDVTERLRAEEAQARLAAIVEGSDDAIIGKTLDGIVTSWNAGAQRLFGYTAEEMVGQPIARMVPRDRIDETPSILATIRRGGRVEHYETQRVRKDGERISVSLSISPIRDAEGNITGASKIARDVTERKLAEAERERLLAVAETARAEAEAASRAKDDLLSTVSHELRTPLAAMLGWVSVLRQGKLSPERTARALETIERSGRLQAELIDDLLDVSRIVTGRLKLEVRLADLRAIAGAALDAIRPVAAAKGVRIDAALVAGSIVAGDPIRLHQVVSNVLNNAVKFTPSGGAVELRIEQTDGAARIVVRDTGCGIPPQFLPQVFEPFRQAEDVKKRTRGGLGLGLAIVRSLVEQHRGTVTAESAGEGSGSTFTITLPLADGGGPDLPHEGGKPREPDLPRLDGVRILIVDDEPDGREALRTLLEAWGANVTTATSVRDASAALDMSEPDVLISDIRMPEEDGYALVRELRASERLRGVPAVALTAYHQDDAGARAAAAGFQAYLRKPVEPESLLTLVASLAAREAGQ